MDLPNTCTPDTEDRNDQKVEWIFQIHVHQTVKIEMARRLKGSS